MTLLIGTADGAHRVDDLPFEATERVLDAGTVHGVTTSETGDALAATDSGLYRSGDGGGSWRDLGLPREAVWSVLAAGGELYAGTAPAHLYRSTDGGDSWVEVESLQAQPSRPRWTSPVGDDARLRTLGTHPDTPELLVAGIEAGKLHVSTDGGETWAERDDPVPDDVHHVLVRGPEEFVVSTGFLGLDGRQPGGCYRTTDAGETWTRLDSGERPYFRTTIEYGGRLHASAARDSPPAWGDGADAVLYESEDGGTLASVPYPGAPDEVVDAWAVADGRVIAGTTAGPRGSVLRRSGDGEWRRAGGVPSGIHSLAPL